MTEFAWMALAALVVSLVSVALTGFLWKIERARHHEERRPRIGFTVIGPMPDPEHPDKPFIMCALKNDGPEDVEQVLLELLNGPVLGMRQGPGTAETELELGPLKLGESVVFVMDRDDGRLSPFIAVRATVQGKQRSDTWRLVLEGEIPKAVFGP